MPLWIIEPTKGLQQCPPLCPNNTLNSNLIIIPNISSLQTKTRTQLHGKIQIPRVYRSHPMPTLLQYMHAISTSYLLFIKFERNIFFLVKYKRNIIKLNSRNYSHIKKWKSLPCTLRIGHKIREAILQSVFSTLVVLIYIF